MEELEAKHFKCIKRDNSEEEVERRWQIFKIVFDKFYDYLKTKGINENTAGKRTDRAAFFIMNYLFVYGDARSILDISEDTIRKFLGNWYIRRFWDPSIRGIHSYLKAISDFYAFLNERGFVSKEQLSETKAVCKDKAWFEMRLRTYFGAKGDDFYDRIQE
ncbi:MAG TPA: hypothetical protein PK973_06245 [Candidatus Saccharicenans sp.]|nr:hypothetical protein [Candidatus Saccharicenans sp.]HPP24364.1 hypothetical protein [Candidatus Saccharicenans sp.]